MATLVAEPETTEPDLGASASRTGRLASIDAIRGFTILAMIFVNDVAGVRGAPAWMKHIQPASADGMTFVDVVFPAFLFIVGMSIPFALERRFQVGDSLSRIWGHILVRTLSLLLIGVFMVNTEVISSDGPLHPSLWTLLMYLGVILVWVMPSGRGAVRGFRTITRRGHSNAGRPESERGRTLVIGRGGLLLDRSFLLGLRIAGIVLLVVLALLYRGGEGGGLIEMRTYWWGILGLIGWAYVTACAVYLLFRRNVAALVGAMALLYCLYAAHAGGAFEGLSWLTQWVNLGSTIGSHSALVVSGVILGVMLFPANAERSHRDVLRRAFVFSLGLAAAAYLLHGAADIHRMFIINKIYATPPWSLWCAAITIWVWIPAYWLLDVRKDRRWSALLEHSGQNALLAYILAPIFYALFAFTAATLAVSNAYARLGASYLPGLLRGVAFAVAIVWMAAWLRRRGYILKL